VIQLLAHLWGDYLLQSQWMADNKTKQHGAAFVHALIYSLLFVPFCFQWEWPYWLRHSEVPYDVGFHFRWLAWVVIFGTHFLVDRYRLARYVIFAKNLMAPQGERYPRIRDEWDDCKSTGYAPSLPPWLAVWLLIIADNTLHLTINYLALRYL